jgi:oligopeptide/dipeptide ABC transporter ATP-binding protein
MEKIQNKSILDVKHLTTEFSTPKGVIKAVNDVSFCMEKGKTLALVGESGCGKSVTALSIMGLIAHPGKVTKGEILFEDKNILTYSNNQMRKIRGNRISMIFQEPMTSLNPVFRIKDQMTEVFLEHQSISKSEALHRSVELLAMVGIPSPEKRIQEFPHHLSGGMRQRVMIAMALTSRDPGLLIADEPTTALDVTIQAQILKLIRNLQKSNTMSLLLITHDMGVVAQMADRVAVMYAGKKIEEADVIDLFEDPKHPYTKGLLNSIPSNRKYRGAKRLESIKGFVPNLLTLGRGCPFANRCSFVEEICHTVFPTSRLFGKNHRVSCHASGGCE